MNEPRNSVGRRTPDCCHVPGVPSSPGAGHKVREPGLRVELPTSQEQVVARENGRITMGTILSHTTVSTAQKAALARVLASRYRRYALASSTLWMDFR